MCLRCACLGKEDIYDFLYYSAAFGDDALVQSMSKETLEGNKVNHNQDASVFPNQWIENI